MKQLITILLLTISTTLLSQAFVAGWNDEGNILPLFESEGSVYTMEQNNLVKYHEGMAFFAPEVVKFDLKTTDKDNLHRHNYKIHSYKVTNLPDGITRVDYIFVRKNKVDPISGVLLFDDETWCFYLHTWVMVFFYRGDLF